GGGPYRIEKTPDPIMGDRAAFISNCDCDVHVAVARRRHGDRLARRSMRDGIAEKIRERLAQSRSVPFTHEGAASLDGDWCIRRRRADLRSDLPHERTEIRASAPKTHHVYTTSQREIEQVIDQMRHALCAALNHIQNLMR